MQWCVGGCRFWPILSPTTTSETTMIDVPNSLPRRQLLASSASALAAVGMAT